MSEYERGYSFPNRSLCSILEDMRQCIKTLNFSYLAGILEEAQWAANRMESSLSDVRDIRELKEERSKLKVEVMKLREERDALKPSKTEKKSKNVLDDIA